MSVYSETTMLKEEIECFALYNLKLTEFCHFCLNPEGPNCILKRCTGCKFIFYCSPKCQKADWKLHKEECAALKNIPFESLSNFDDSIRIILRLAVLYASGSFAVHRMEDSDGKVVERTIMHLVTHPNDAALEIKAIKFVVQFKELVNKRIVGDDVIKRLFKASSINSFALDDCYGSSIGVALCTGMTAIDHSCRPRTRLAYRGRFVEMMPVCLDQFQRSYNSSWHSYIDELQPKKLRQAILEHTYKFSCTCDGCMDDEWNDRMEAWVCEKCEEGWIPPGEDTRCKNCNNRPERDHIDACKMAVETTSPANHVFLRTDVTHDQKLDLAKKLETIVEGLLHPTNVLRLPTYTYLFNTYRKQNNMLTEAIFYGCKILKLQQTYRQENDIQLCYFKYRLAEVYMKLDNRESAAVLIDQDVIKVFGLAHGEESGICVRCREILY